MISAVLQQLESTPHTFDYYRPDRLVILRFEVLNLSHYALAAKNLSKYNMLAIEVGCGYSGNEELRSIGGCRRIQPDFLR